MQGETTALQQFKYILLIITTRYEKQQVENAKKKMLA